MKVCATPGCPTLTEDSYCPPCKSEKRKASDAKRPNPRQRGYTKEHERHRQLMQTLAPICQHQGCTQPSTDLDHIDGDPFNKTFTNYRMLCHSHHSQRTARDQPGGFNA